MQYDFTLKEKLSAKSIIKFVQNGGGNINHLEVIEGKSWKLVFFVH